MECQVLGTGDSAIPRPPPNPIMRSAAVAFFQGEAKSKCKEETDHQKRSHKMNKANNKSNCENNNQDSLCPHVPHTALAAFYVWVTVLSQALHEADRDVIPIVQMRTLRHTW